MIKAVKPLFTMSALALAVTSISAQAEDSFRQHGAHVHGSVEFNIAQDGQDLLVEIIAPGADVVGFEHAPKTDEQKKTFESALATLNNANSVLSFTQAAGCELQTAEISNTLGQDDHEGHDHHDDHAGHDHDHDHDGHGEFNIAYQFQCKDVSKLSEIDTAWFDLFPSTERVNVNLLTDKAQVAAELVKNNTVIKL